MDGVSLCGVGMREEGYFCCDRGGRIELLFLRTVNKSPTRFVCHCQLLDNRRTPWLFQYHNLSNQILTKPHAMASNILVQQHKGVWTKGSVGSCDVDVFVWCVHG